MVYLHTIHLHVLFFSFIFIFVFYSSHLYLPYLFYLCSPSGRSRGNATLFRILYIPIGQFSKRFVQKGSQLCRGVTAQSQKSSEIEYCSTDVTCPICPAFSAACNPTCTVCCSHISPVFITPPSLPFYFSFLLPKPFFYPSSFSSFFLSLQSSSLSFSLSLSFLLSFLLISPLILSFYFCLVFLYVFSVDVENDFLTDQERHETFD